MRYVRKIKTIGYLRVRDVIGSVDSEHAVNYLKSYEKFIQEPFTFVGKKVFEKKVGALFEILFFFRRLEKRI